MNSERCRLDNHNNDNANTVVYYLRMDNYKWISEFRKGNMWLNCPLVWHKGNNKAIVDDMESVKEQYSQSVKTEDFPYTINGGTILSDDVEIKYSLYHEEAHKDRAFCMYKLETRNGKFILSDDEREKIKSFNYDCFCIISNVDTLLQRIANVLNEPIYKIRIDDINYTHKNVDRDKFDKPERYFYQHETRILITKTSIPDYNDESYPPLDFYIGSIEDITSDIFCLESLCDAHCIDDFAKYL
jgi:hypothetical protein